MAGSFYSAHYRDKISEQLTEIQKKDIANRISELTLKAPIWTNRNTDFAKDFPEIAPFVNVQLSGLYLCSILSEIVNELAAGSLKS